MNPNRYSDLGPIGTFGAQRLQGALATKSPEPVNHEHRKADPEQEIGAHVKIPGFQPWETNAIPFLNLEQLKKLQARVTDAIKQAENKVKAQEMLRPGDTGVIVGSGSAWADSSGLGSVRLQTGELVGVLQKTPSESKDFDQNYLKVTVLGGPGRDGVVRYVLAHRVRRATTADVAGRLRLELKG